MESIFNSFTEVISGSSGVFLMLTTTFVWGVLSLLLSPCHLTAVPLVVGYVNRQEKPTILRDFRSVPCFLLGCC